MSRILFIFLLLFPLIINAQIITTVAGDGTAGYFGDGSPATTGKLSHPIEIAIDASGNLYIAENGNSTIRKVSTSGIISTVAGTGTAGYSGDGFAATLAKLNMAYGVAVDVAGNIYITDETNQRIRKVNTSGIITTIAGTGVAGYNGDGIAATLAQISYPAFIRLDNAGNIYFSDNGNQRVRKINTAGIISTIAGNGTIGYSGDGFPATTANLSFPSGVWFDNITGNLFIADGTNSVIRKVDPSGIISTVAGNTSWTHTGDGGPAIAAGLYEPEDMITDVAGNLYIADNLNNCVRMVNTSGIISTIVATGVAGYFGDGGPATLAQLNNVNGLAFNSAGDLFIDDVANNVIRKVSSSGNHPPSFNGGSSQSLKMCVNDPAVQINSLLAVNDADAGQTLTWSMVNAPAHGIVAATYTTTSTGSTVTPTGLTYTPTPLYTGGDLFSVRVTDGIAADTTTINVTVNPLPDGGIISGIDSVCPGQSVPLFETESGGIWSYSSMAVTNITFGGVVTGMAPGADTVIYTIINSCGIVSAIFPFKVRSYIECRRGVNAISENAGIDIYPNPSKGKISVNIYSGAKEAAQLTITNVVGQKLKEYTISTNEPVELSPGLAPCIYFIEVVTKNGMWSTKLVVTP